MVDSNSDIYSENRNILPRLLPKRIKKRLDTISSYIWEDVQRLDVYGGPVNDEFFDLSTGKQQEMDPVQEGEYFGPPNADHNLVEQWQQRWFRVDIPGAEEGDERPRALHWDCMGETTVYIDDVPWAGLDVGHPYCLLPHRACTLWLDCGAYQTAIWVGGKKPDDNGLRFDGARLASRNEFAWCVYWDFEVLFRVMEHLISHEDADDAFRSSGLVPELTSCHPVLRILINRLNRACNAFDLHGLRAMKEELDNTYQELRAEPWQLKAIAFGHSHMDHVWYWAEEVGERKGLHTAANAVQLLDRYPEFRFMWSAPAMYEAIRNRSPAVFDRIRHYIAEGRWEATGGMWVEADTHMPCGEALARCLILGQRYFADLREGNVSKTVWLPDVFGYNVCMPQLMNEVGISSFSTTKMSWSSVTGFPYDSFVWKGPDGSEVLAHMTQINYWRQCDPSVYADVNRSYRQRAVHDEVLRPEGFGDGGGGPSEYACERARRMRDLAQVPKTQWGNVEDFFDRLASVKDELPVYEGELYLELHQGTFTTQGRFKEAYRQAEAGLQTLEAVRALRGGEPVDEYTWQRVALAQFHDALPGTSIGDYYDEATPELRDIAENKINQAGEELTVGHDTATGQQYLFNPTPLPRRAVVKLTGPMNDGAAGSDTTAIQEITEETGEEAKIAAVQMAPLSVHSLSDALEPSGCGNWEVSETVMDNGRTRVVFDADGRVCRLVVDGRDVPLAQPAFFSIYPDEPAAFEAWDIDQASLSLGQAAVEPLKLEVVEDGPVRGRLRGRSDVGQASTLVVDYVLTADSPWLQVELSIDWHEDKKLLKYHLPTAYRGRFARFGTPFGSVLRSQVGDGPASEAMWEVPGSRWAAVGDDTGDTGAAMVTEAKYGFSCRNGDLAVSLLRSPKDPDREADMGQHMIRFAVGRHQVRHHEESLNTAAVADSLYAPVLQGEFDDAVSSPFAIENGEGTLVPAWCAPSVSGKGIILRLHETMGEHGTAVLTCAGQNPEVAFVNLMEERTGVPEQLKENVFRIPYTPYRVVSLWIDQDT